MITFEDTRNFLLTYREDYASAYSGFRWPAAVPFNWALDWFDARLATEAISRDRPALWIGS
jgi:acetyl-CoA synthetase